MQLKKIIYILLAILLLESCIREVEVLVEIPVYKETTVKFTLYTSTFSTRAPEDHHSTFPQLEERRIFNYAILIFNINNKLEAAMVASPYDPNVPGSKGLDTDGYTPLYFTNEEGKETEVTLTSGQKKLFALVNAPQPLWDDWMQMIQNEEKTLEDYMAYTLNVGRNGGIDYITGTNETPVADERGFMMTSSNLESIYLEPTITEPTTITVRVGRSMSKASLASDLASNPRNKEQQPNGELTNISYKIKNNPYEMYVIPSITNGYTYTPYFTNNTVTSYFHSSDYIPVSKQNALTQLYCMENGNENPNSQNASLMVIKGTYTPDILYRADGETLFEGYTTGNDFWRITEIIDGQRVYTDKYYAEDPSGYMEENHRLVHYINGETYYFLYLDREDNQYPYPHNYTVKRNSFYTIDLIKISNAGEEDEEPDTDLPGPGPNPPPSDESKINVTITIKEWDLIQGNGEL